MNQQTLDNKRYAPTQNDIENLIGKVFYHSWGYDQTQNDFLLVEGITKSKKSAICRMINQITVKTEMTYYMVKPDPLSKKGPQFKLRIKGEYFGPRICLRGSYPYSIHGNDAYRPLSALYKMLGTFFLYEAGDNGIYETNPVFGH